MRGIILAGGTGSRLYPLTKVTNKHLLPVARKPMIYHPIEKLTSAGITDILIVTGVEHMGDIVTLLGSGKEFGCKFTYKVQDEAGGIAQALGLAHDFAHKDKMVVILGDNLFQDDLTPFVEKFLKQKEGAMVLLKEVNDPHRFGVAFFKNGKIVGIEEKPKKPKSNLAVTGIYFFDSNVFDVISNLKPSKRGELEVSDVNSAYLKNKKLEYSLLSGWWSDAGTFESLERSTLLVEGKIRL
ncbi:spore coat protein [candidate division WOR-1 bacterium RIFOXYB2_FULL_37_13]|uniref:Glucose-1-phosphate thymidylyltransferase n=1 Tax=candidate division WOR-1 bacterium RIFOXYB2_FULL_37_13 TaxID=1802579 RepID=A0A1F4SH59_UNCSA|nr:MAG: spore coat protein [candidate division WOR-1 bacterium RIFOXYB2_FULL_37_13]